MRIVARLLALAACIYPNHELGRPSRAIADYASRRGINHLMRKVSQEAVDLQVDSFCSAVASLGLVPPVQVGMTESDDLR